MSDQKFHEIELLPDVLRRRRESRFDGSHQLELEGLITGYRVRYEIGRLHKYKDNESRETCAFKLRLFFGAPPTFVSAVITPKAAAPFLK